MGETSMTPGSGTRGGESGQQKPVELYKKGSEPAATDHKSQQSNLYAVRVSSAAAKVVIQVDTKRLSERKRIRAMNDSIKRRTRG
jgi:hypothetical protein